MSARALVTSLLGRLCMHVHVLLCMCIHALYVHAFVHVNMSYLHVCVVCAPYVHVCLCIACMHVFECMYVFTCMVCMCVHVCVYSCPLAPMGIGCRTPCGYQNPRILRFLI